MKRRAAVVMTIWLSLAFVLTGCAPKEESAYYIYYITPERTGMVPQSYEPRAKDTEGLLVELLDKLAEDTDSVDYMKTIPAKIEVMDYRVDKRDLSLYFDRDYSTLEGYEEVLIRSAIVRTLLQIDGIDSITFYVSNEPLLSAAGEMVGSMNRDSFLFDFGEETDSLLSTTLSLYFASADGASLVKEERQVYYSSNIALEKLVIDNLLKGPNGENAIGTLPANTKLLNISVTDGVCYVNLDNTFLNTVEGVSDEVTIYSIVNSLTELDHAAKVQILVDGENNIKYHDTFDLSGLLERSDVSLSENVNEDVESMTKEILVE